MGHDRVVAALARDYRSAELEDGDRAMLDYAIKLTRHPQDISEEDVEQLRQVGFSDTAIVDICQITAYYNYVNRLADGLGVELEAYWEGEELTLGRDEFEQLRLSRSQASDGA